MRILAEDIDEHVFELATAFTKDTLGICERAGSTTVLVGDDEHAISQSLPLLSTSTGAMVWETTPLFAQWICTVPSRVRDVVFGRSVIELGCGTGALAKILAPHAAAYYATDQKPLLKIARANCAGLKNVTVAQFDWELHEFTLDVTTPACIVACDTIYNEHLIAAFIGAVKSVIAHIGPVETVVAVQVREPSVLAHALEAFASAGFEIDYIDDPPPLLAGHAVYILTRQVCWS